MCTYMMSTGNIFEDLELPEPDIQLSKVQIVLWIEKEIFNRNLSYNEIEELFEIKIGEWLALSSGRVRGISLDRLIQMLRRLNQEVEILIKENRGNATPAALKVAFA